MVNIILLLVEAWRIHLQHKNITCSKIETNILPKCFMVSPPNIFLVLFIIYTIRIVKPPKSTGRRPAEFYLGKYGIILTEAKCVLREGRPC